jgi:hypothetical protein
MSLRFDAERQRSTVPAGPLRGIMPRPMAIRPPPAAATGFARPAAPASAAGVRPMQQAGRPAAQPQRSGRAAYGGRGEPPPCEAGWDACLDWASGGGFETEEDRSLAFRAWAGMLRPADAA